MDTDEGKWKNFVAEHKMTWMQARDAGWNGPIGARFGVNAIPHTLSIDADGVLQDEHVGDEAMEGKLKKLVAQAQQMHPAGALVEEGKPPVKYWARENSSFQLFGRSVSRPLIPSAETRCRP